jgi:hypothetical protein
MILYTYKMYKLYKNYQELLFTSLEMEQSPVMGHWHFINHLLMGLPEIWK